MENQVQKSVPNAMLIMICGIISIPFCCGVGTVAGVIALIMSSKANKLISQDPNGYIASEVKNVKLGRTCSMIGLGLQVLAFLFYIVYFVVIIGIAGSSF
tara:strand:+ start:861 stop:1160 length:300 start_codon:yes stop_codon:yes gene_type:complete